MAFFLCQIVDFFPAMLLNTLHSCHCFIYCKRFGQQWTFTLFGKLIRIVTAFYKVSCSSAQVFASDFLQIPRHHGHPCLQLTVPTTKPVVDFHHLVITHAKHTKKIEDQQALVFDNFFYSLPVARWIALTISTIGMIAKDAPATIPHWYPSK